MTVGQKIKARREELKMSQEELAQKCGYKSRSSINKIEMSRDLPLKKVKLMANALDLPVSYLMGWDEECYNVAANDYEEQLFIEIKKLKADSQKHLLEYIKLLLKEGK